MRLEVSGLRSRCSEPRQKRLFEGRRAGEMQPTPNGQACRWPGLGEAPLQEGTSGRYRSKADMPYGWPGSAADRAVAGYVPQLLHRLLLASFGGRWGRVAQSCKLRVIRWEEVGVLRRLGRLYLGACGGAKGRSAIVSACLVTDNGGR